MRNQDACGCYGTRGGPRVNRPLAELSDLVAMLEKRRSSVNRIIAEIETHLSFPIKDVESYWENEERRSLGELVALLRA